MCTGQDSSRSLQQNGAPTVTQYLLLRNRRPSPRAAHFPPVKVAPSGLTSAVAITPASSVALGPPSAQGPGLVKVTPASAVSITSFTLTHNTHSTHHPPGPLRTFRPSQLRADVMTLQKSLRVKWRGRGDRAAATWGRRQRRRRRRRGEGAEAAAAATTTTTQRAAERAEAMQRGRGVDDCSDNDADGGSDGADDDDDDADDGSEDAGEDDDDANGGSEGAGGGGGGETRTAVVTVSTVTTQTAAARCR
ncbi:hypothetical protein EDB85DRAFT_1901338 [Lactarius pseudohatsudake]|nr:hypothetical protein EDB85DRAFT_1901338 [Lactarius pseudohatsudake]